jgi:nicotinic acid phosphoribosyltransferase
MLNINEIKKWAKKHNIEERTKKDFFEFLDNYKLECSDEYQEIFSNISKKDLKLQIHKVSLNLGNWPECSYNTISVSMWIFYKEKQLANYKALYTLDGEDEDDFFEVF